jgi:hypothetical protein
VQQERRPPLRHCRIDHSVAHETLETVAHPCICFQCLIGPCST